MKTYKGFDKDFKCRDFQYEVGKDYKMPEDGIKVCKNGFHACESPLEVLDHYPLFDKDGNSNRFAEVEQSGNIDKEPNSTKVCSSRIRVKAELSLAGLIKAGVEWILNSVKGTAPREGAGQLNDNSGDFAKIGSSGDYAQIGSSGDSAQIGSSGYSAQIGSSGECAQIGSSGDYAQIGSSGYSAKIGSSGYSAKIGSSGYSAKIGSSGYSAQIGSSGHYAQIGSSGHYAQIGSSGDYAQIGSSGDSAQIGSSGYYAQINSTGEDSVICCAGHECMVKAKQGSWVTLSEWKWDETKKRAVPVMVKTIRIDGKRYKADTWYMLKNKKVVKVQEGEQ